MSDFNTISNPYGYLALFVPKTPLVVWHFISSSLTSLRVDLIEYFWLPTTYCLLSSNLIDIINLILSNSCSYLALFESKSAVIFIFFLYPIIFFKLYKITQTLHRVFFFPI